MGKWRETELGLIPVDWKIVTSIDYCDKITDGTHDSPKRTDVGKKLITSKHIKGRNIDYVNAYLISEEDFCKINVRSKVDQWDVIVSMIGEYCGFTYIERNHEINYAVKNVGIFKCFDEKKAFWLYYYIQSPHGKSFLEYNKSGTSQPYITLGTLRKLPIVVPDSIEERNKILTIIGSLDDKIDLLHRQNATLEKMAETLFRQYFIEEAKPEWEEKRLVDFVCHLKKSVHPKKDPTTIFDHYSIPSFDKNKNPDKDLGSDIQSNKYEVPKYCILFSKLNPHKDKRVWLLLNDVTETSICSTEFQVIKPIAENYLFFIYGWLSYDENYNEIASGVGGTSGSHQRIDPNTIFSFKCPDISETYIIEYNKQVSPLFLKQALNQQQIRTLTALRNTLLPKLMSGEVRVKMGT